MEQESRRVLVASDSELAQLIKQAAAGTIVVVDTGDGLYRMDVSPTTHGETEMRPQIAGEARRVESPQDFYERVTQCPDVRALLKRLAE